MSHDRRWANAPAPWRLLASALRRTGHGSHRAPRAGVSAAVAPLGWISVLALIATVTIAAGMDRGIRVTDGVCRLLTAYQVQTSRNLRVSTPQKLAAMLRTTSPAFHQVTRPRMPEAVRRRRNGVKSSV